MSNNKIELLKQFIFQRPCGIKLHMMITNIYIPHDGYNVNDFLVKIITGFYFC